MLEKNWAGNHVYRAARIHAPRTIADTQQLVADSARIRSLGTRHSFNDVGDGEGDLVTLTGINPEFQLDVDSGSVTVTGGTSYGVLASWLEERGCALHNMASLPHISVAGAIATGTHGSGNSNGNLSSAVRALHIIGPEGHLSVLRRGDPDFAGAVVSLGALGIVARVTLDVGPSYLVRQDVYLDLPWDVVLERFDEIARCGYSVSLFTDWTGNLLGRMWVKTRLVDGMPGEMPTELFGASLAATGLASPADEANDNTTVQGGVPGPWSERLPHFRIDATPSNGHEIQTEYLIRRSDAVQALSALRHLGPVIEPALLISELRTVAADELWLSTAFERDSLAIHFTWKYLPALVAAVVPRVEQALAPFDPRPHWGKYFQLDRRDYASSYPRLPGFIDLVHRTDPAGKFGNGYLRRVLGVASAVD
jgi:xylitol oxidase